jgi:alkaline phosphatase D
VQYKVGSDSTGWSQPFTFTNEPNARPLVFGVYADFGFSNDESLPALMKDAAAGGFDYVIHAGDWAYDLDSWWSSVGNNFMNSIQPYAATVPYMGSAGNHEAYGTQGGGNFSQFVLRNRALQEGVGQTSGSNTNLYYSFETPLIHWVAFTAETWTMSEQQIATQAAWLQKDLSSVDRSVTPWVVAFSHKSFQMDQTTWGLFDVLVENKVDVQFVGHWHQYTRFPPIDSRNGKVVVDYASLSNGNTTYTDAQYPVIIVAGAPGNQEVDPRTCTEEWQINCTGNYGYGHFQVINATHAHWVWETTVPVKGGPDPTFRDDVWFVKTA